MMDVMGEEQGRNERTRTGLRWMRQPNRDLMLDGRQPLTTLRRPASIV